MYVYHIQIAVRRLQKVFAFLANHSRLGEVIAFRPIEKTPQPRRQLLDRNSAGRLSAEEEAAQDTLELINDLLALLKIQARGTVRAPREFSSGCFG